MERLNLKSPWPEVKERLKENDISLTDEDLEYREGAENELLSRLSAKMQKSEDEVRRYIESISANDDKSG